MDQKWWIVILVVGIGVALLVSNLGNGIALGPLENTRPKANPPVVLPTVQCGGSFTQPVIGYGVSGSDIVYCPGQTPQECEAQCQPILEDANQIALLKAEANAEALAECRTNMNIYLYEGTGLDGKNDLPPFHEYRCPEECPGEAVLNECQITTQADCSLQSGTAGSSNQQSWCSIVCSGAWARGSITLSCGSSFVN